MFRRRNSDKARLEPEMCVLLRSVARYPGDVLQGVVIVDFGAPVDLLTLEVRICGDERTTLGGLLVTDKNPEARKMVYYEQFVTLRGVDHDSLEQRRGLLGRRRTIVAQDSAAVRKSASTASSVEVPSAENSISDLSPSILNAAAGSGTTVHLIPGTYSFPFKVTLPDTLPQSRELHRAREGTSLLRYRVFATLILVGGKVYSAETPFRVNPLPVQMQRWFQLHGDEQNGTDASEADDLGMSADFASPAAESGSAKPGLRSMLLSSPGTISTDAADREREVTCQRRIRHYRQFPEHQLAAERAEYEKRVEELLATAKKSDKKADNRNNRKADKSGGKKKKSGSGADGGEEEDDDEDDGPSSPQGVREMKKAEEEANSRKLRPTSFRERRARQEEADNRSLDGNGDHADVGAGGDEEGEDEYDEDEVRAFETNATGSAAATPPPEKSTLAANAAADAANTSKEKKKKHRHHSKSGAGEAKGKDSAMVEDNVDQLAFTPPDKELAPVPAHMAVRHSVDTTNDAASQKKKKKESSRRKSHDKKGAEEEEEEDEEAGEDGDQKSQGTQAHRRRSRFVPPPWHQEFNISLRGGFLRTGKVKVKLSLRSPLVSVGYGRVMVKLLVDNSDGSGTITKVKYSLITRCYIRTKTEVYNYHIDNVETLADVNIEKGNVVAIPEVEVPVPRSTPLTMLTEGQGTLTFLNVRFYVGTTLKTFSKSVETEVVLVSGQDSQNSSRRLLRWSCFFRRRNSDDTRDLTVRPPTINLSEQNSKVRVMQASELTRSPSGLYNSSNANGADADTSSMAPSAMSRSLSIMRSSRRVAKDAPSLDARRLASALNYDEAIFVPPSEEDGPAGPSSHVDPMSMLNPFAMPSNIGSTLPSADREEEAEQR